MSTSTPAPANEPFPAIAGLLRTLRLPTIGRLWRDLCRQAQDDGWSHVRLLQALLEHEVAERDQRRIAARRQASRLPAGKTLASFDVNQAAGLDAALAKAFRYDTEALVEPRVTDLYELNVSVLRSDALHVSVVEQPVSKTGVLTYEEKYGTGDSGAKRSMEEARSMAAARRKIDPPEVPGDVKQEVQRLAALAFEALGCAGVARLDFIIDRGKVQASLENPANPASTTHSDAPTPACKLDGVYLNEINTLPGSLAYYLWEATNPPRTYTALLTELIEATVHAHGYRDSLRQQSVRPLFGGK